MALKKLLVAFSTDREIDGETRRVRFAANSVVELTADELDLLDRLTDATGKLHYREPISEGGVAVASEPEIVVVPDYAGQDVPMDKKSVEQLQAYLTFHGVAYAASAKKADLLALATDGVGNTDGDGSGDPDGGL